MSRLRKTFLPQAKQEGKRKRGMERDQGHGYRYDGGHSGAQGYGHAYAGYDDNATEHLVSGRQDGENTLSPGEQEDDQDDGVQTRVSGGSRVQSHWDLAELPQQHGGGRPRDPIWSYFTGMWLPIAPQVGTSHRSLNNHRRGTAMQILQLEARFPESFSNEEPCHVVHRHAGIRQSRDTSRL